ncbi:MAG: SDR family NAD(P)-dependent oxidoreductase, partial [Acidimicrobiia bacterium]|nr:SDR family NAD(P)-dependent oxidoreductase [Acidimicrobiia bacterium]
MSRVALVTGGSRGIGRAVCMEMAGRGCRVAVNYARRSDAAAEVVESIRGAGGEAVAIGADVSDADQVNRMFSEVKKALGPVEILVNNAGITRDGLLARMSPEQFDEVLAVNLRSAYLCTKAALRGML